ncbi:DUF805 domain-containing protein [Suttonella ornithocola]|uniref:Inner membrane protein yhaH n=1 Tax=Suttonella ornithocola TaxID=279832 RepID=A0A380MYM7_9GAMM|nr:DUF805 domain-containing protein [Suttonella ornithocola]SUO97649.1 Inner membrane protein yhaH [Suttonella ornithocola]
MNWYLTCLKKYATFSGRAQRKELWFFFLFYIIIVIVLTILDIFTGLYDPQTGSGILSGIFQLAMFLPSLAVQVRRLHDIGKNGWWWLIALTGIGAFVLIYFYCLGSEKGANQYGANPKEV